jgi:serine/threonine protein kinase
MENNQNHIIIKNLATKSDNSLPVSLPDGTQKIPLGSGVITRLLGRGGMAAVYEIWNPQLEIYRAVKIINPSSTEHVHERFQTEIKISAKLNHPNIVEIHAVGEWNGLPYIEMEKIEGIGLDKLIAERGALPSYVCTAIGIMICRALNYAHHQDCTIYGKKYHGVIHRDLKPANIMICTNGIVKLMDFGIARPADVSFHTMDGIVAGTLQYLAPEQLEKKKLDVTTDLYALGVTMYEILTGVPAFPQSSLPKLISEKTKNKFKPLEEYDIKVPKRLKRVIYKCMEQDPAKRIPSAADLLEELHKIHASICNKSPEEVMASFISTESGKKVVASYKKLFPVKTFLFSLIFLVIISITGFYFYKNPEYLKRFLKANTYQKPQVPAQKQEFAQKPKEQQSQIQENSLEPKVAITENKTMSKPQKSFDSFTKEKEIKEKPKQTIPKQPLNFLDALKAKYSTQDIFIIMENELKSGNFLNVLKICDNLPSEKANSTGVLIFKMRALEKTGNIGRLAEFLQNNSINDAEFYLAKAKFAYNNKRYNESKKYLSHSLTLPHAFIDYDVLRQEVYYYTALCETAIFDAEPNETNYKEALDSWWQLRTLLRSVPDHEYNKKAIAELQRMAQKMQQKQNN